MRTCALRDRGRGAFQRSRNRPPTQPQHPQAKPSVLPPGGSLRIQLRSIYHAPRIVYTLGPLGKAPICYGVGWEIRLCLRGRNVDTRLLHVRVALSIGRVRQCRAESRPARAIGTTKARAYWHAAWYWHDGPLIGTTTGLLARPRWWRGAGLRVPARHDATTYDTTGISRRPGQGGPGLCMSAVNFYLQPFLPEATQRGGQRQPAAAVRRASAHDAPNVPRGPRPAPPGLGCNSPPPAPRRPAPATGTLYEDAANTPSDSSSDF